MGELLDLADHRRKLADINARMAFLLAAREPIEQQIALAKMKAGKPFLDKPAHEAAQAGFMAIFADAGGTDFGRARAFIEVVTDRSVTYQENFIENFKAKQSAQAPESVQAPAVS